MSNALLVWHWYRDRFPLVVSGAALLMSMVAAFGHGEWPAFFAWSTAFVLWMLVCRSIYTLERWRDIAREQRRQLDLLESHVREQIQLDASKLAAQIKQWAEESKP